MKKIITLLSLVLCLNINAQTNVSGGIYSNTTWSLSGSPYIVTDTVVVFPGVTLTIQPGVTVKFNTGIQIELRQAALDAMGTKTDSITFTSNSSLTAGSWDEINLNGGTMTDKFNYCVFKYASSAISDNRGSIGDTLIIKNSTFNFNTSGLFGQGTGIGVIDSCHFRYNTNGTSSNYGGSINYCDFSYNSSVGFGCDGFNTLNNCTITHNPTGMSGMHGSTVYNCIIKYNQSGITMTNGVRIKNSTIDSNTVVGISMGASADVDSIVNCQIKYNEVGLNDFNNGSWPNYISMNDIESNSTGIHLQTTLDDIFCNKICNNTTYDLQYTGTSNVSVTNNYWCTPDSAATRAVIYDGYDNASYGLVKFMPMDSICYLTTGIEKFTNSNEQITIYPNPNNGSFVIEPNPSLTLAQGKGTLMQMYDVNGKLVLSQPINGKTSIDASSLNEGVYNISLQSNEGVVNKRVVIVK